MLTLQLTLDNKQITVHADGQESHSFSLLDLGQTNKEWKDFFKDPRPYGGKLFDTLFKDGSKARIAFDEISKQSERTVVLILESSELDGIAWEYAFHDNAYIVEDFAFMRVLPEKERPHTNGRLSKSVERVPLLFIPANPLVGLSGEPMRALDIESEWREMTQHIVNSNAPFDLIELRPATPAALQSVMARFQNGMIAHFSGHGAATKDGAFLLFENENGSSNPLEAREFVREVKDQAWIGFLSACQSAVAERTAYGNLARELVKAGVPFALGMQFNLPDPFAPNISGQFYNYLSQGHAVPEAARQARRVVKRENEFYVGMIALYAAHPDEAGKMGWTGSGARTLSTFAAADVSDLPTPSGFVGRQRELMNIGTSLLGKKKPNTVTLHGAGGIGKTALMRQALLRFAPSFDAALAIGLDPLPSLESVLGRLERFLNLPSPCSNDTKEREKIVCEKLMSKRTLLGLDNFETLNYALNDKSSDEEKTAKGLHSFFKYLAANGVTLCVTSREVTNLGGETIIDIEGLPNDVGGRLFQDNVVRQKDGIYIEKTQQVSEMVSGHPLALRLLASAFDDQIGISLDQYIESLQSFLPKARDKWTEEDRHKSLRASFDFTMKNLLKTEEGRYLQISLTKLEIFIGYFLDFTAAPVLENHIPKTNEEFDQIQPKINGLLHTLWERGLLERAIISFQAENNYLYRTHPALRIMVKEYLTEEAIVKENYWQSMNNLARNAEEQIKKSPSMAQITFSAIPDLIFSSEFKSDIDGAFMRHRVSRILRHFGLYENSIHLLKKSLEICENVSNLYGKAATLHEMAGIYDTRGDLNGAMELYDQSLEIFDGLNDLQGRFANLRGMAGIYSTRRNLDEAINLYQKALQIAKELGDSQGESIILHEMAGISVTQSDFDKALMLYQQSLKIMETLGDLQGRATTLAEVANIYISRGDLNTAMTLYRQSVEILDALRDPRNKTAVLHQMAYIYRVHGDLENAMKLYQQALNIFDGLGDLRGKSGTIFEMAGIYFNREDLDTATKLYQQSLEMFDRLGDLLGKAITLGGIAKIMSTRGDYKNGLALYQEELKIVRNLGVKREEGITLGMIGQIYWALKDPKKAISSLLEAIMILENSGIEPHIQQKMAGNLASWRIELGIERFDGILKEVTGQDTPEWVKKLLFNQSTPMGKERSTNMSIEQFIPIVIQSAREKRSEADAYLKFAQKMEMDSSMPRELQELGKVLQKVLNGDKDLDLSSLTDEWRAIVEKAFKG